MLINSRCIIDHTVDYVKLLLESRCQIISMPYATLDAYQDSLVQKFFIANRGNHSHGLIFWFGTLASSEQYMYHESPGKHLFGIQKVLDSFCRMFMSIFQDIKWSQKPPISIPIACKNLQSVWDAPSFSLESCYCGNLCGATERSCRFGLCTIPRKYQQSNRKYRIPGDSICSTSYR